LALGYITHPVKAEMSFSLSPQSDPDTAACLSCHAQSDWSMKLANGDTLNLSMDYDVFRQSVHKDMMCTECHIGYEKFPAPHNQIEAKSKREYLISYHDTCQKCHQEQFKQVSDSIHDSLFMEGNLDTPLCSDCHQPHSQTHLDLIGPAMENGKISWQAQICADCHLEAFEEYKNSVHGSGLLAGDGKDVADCVDCHNVHEILNTTLSQFRKTSVDICAKCHTDTDAMQKYGLETNVLETYMVFHGTTITMLEDYNPDSLTNKPTCYDCHGIHEVGKFTPPNIEASISAMTLYPEVEVKQAGPPIENVGITGIIVGILIGSVGALTINQLFKERKQDLFEE
jgi:predicted CXXCH cytochrome family protein